MGFLSGTWLRYFDRSYEQIKAQVLTRMQARVPEITDHNESNLFVKITDIFAAIAEMLGYYTDNAGREAHLDSCRLYASGISHARRSDYRVRGKLPAYTELLFAIPAAMPDPVIIPVGTPASNNAGNVIFYTTEEATIPVGETVSNIVIAVNERDYLNYPAGISNGAPKQEFNLGLLVEDNTAIVRVNDETWTRVESLVPAIPTSKYFVQTIDKDGFACIIFGDGYAGAIPGAGLEIRADFKVTIGAAANVEVADIDFLPEQIFGATVSVTNLTKGIAGADEESLDQLKYRIPLHNRTNRRAVTPQDYQDIAELAPGVARAGKKVLDGRNINLYIVPEGGGIAPAPLLDSVENFFEDKKLAGRRVHVFSAGEVKPLLEIDIVVQPQYRNADVEAAVRANLLNHISYREMQVQGELLLGDIYQIVETTPGVKSSTVRVMTTVPYALPLNDTTPVLDWDAAVLPASTNPVTWRINFIAATVFELYKNNGYVGDFEVGTLVEMPEVNFTLDGTYAANDQWQFITYPYFGNMALEEPSIFTAYTQDITLNMIGGL